MDLRKAGLKLVSKLKWKKISKFKHSPVKFTLRVETLYGILEQMDVDPGTTPMPTPRQKKEQLVDSFPKDYQLAYDLRGGEYDETFAKIGQIMEDHYDRENESDSSSSSSDSSSESEKSSDTSSGSDSSDSKKKKKHKSKKRKGKKGKKSRKERKKPKHSNRKTP